MERQKTHRTMIGKKIDYKRDFFSTEILTGTIQDKIEVYSGSGGHNTAYLVTLVKPEPPDRTGFPDGLLEKEPPVQPDKDEVDLVDPQYIVNIYRI